MWESASLEEREVHAAIGTMLHEARMLREVVALAVLEHKQAALVEQVTFWNLSDRDSWLGADNFPLLIDRNYKPKPAYYIVRDLAGE